MSTFNVKEAAESAAPPAGAYPATLKEIVGPEESEYGERYRFIFASDNGDTYIGFADKPKMGPTTKNKLGQWLCALEGKKPQAANVETDKYIGKRYMVVYAANTKGNVALMTFSPMA